MTRYQLQIVDGHLVDLVDELAAHALESAVVSTGGKIRDREAYPAVFDACRGLLKACVRGFHVCGAETACDAESRPTELAEPSAPAHRARNPGQRTVAVRRYVLFLEIPLREFARDLAVHVLRILPSHAKGPDRRLRGLYPAVLAAVEKVLGRYLLVSPACNSERYLCELGFWTEFDPWDIAQPKEDRRWPGRFGGFGRRRSAFRGERRRRA